MLNFLQWTTLWTSVCQVSGWLRALTSVCQVSGWLCALASVCQVSGWLRTLNSVCQVSVCLRALASVCQVSGWLRALTSVCNAEAVNSRVMWCVGWTVPWSGAVSGGVLQHLVVWSRPAAAATSCWWYPLWACLTVSSNTSEEPALHAGTHDCWDPVRFKMCCYIFF